MNNPVVFFFSTVRYCNEDEVVLTMDLIDGGPGPSPTKRDVT
jgi:hypothetical protein